MNQVRRSPSMSRGDDRCTHPPSLAQGCSIRRRSEVLEDVLDLLTLRLVGDGGRTVEGPEVDRGSANLGRERRAVKLVAEPSREIVGRFLVEGRHVRTRERRALRRSKARTIGFSIALEPHGKRARLLTQTRRAPEQLGGALENGIGARRLD